MNAATAPEHLKIRSDAPETSRIGVVESVPTDPLLDADLAGDTLPKFPRLLNRSPRSRNDVTMRFTRTFREVSASQNLSFVD